ncbi:MAG: hypothetical protein E7Z94_04440 [Actinomyces ruminicola]|uniref:Uncharacterized protein n=1 Tax=Actinomyces ruminicola TaxID=332524 RepID=A0A1G9ZQC1_9ACTO|nr:hypothetical protein [Actinomyces ruminicola]MBE6481619.1 hypothetical protein [Actinomyces ruminicola]SDN23374.1 hypothetical protein SAMN04487766_11913 [Actinomyces ruminicola]SDN87328.1 hypothetical protein SAMN05216355_12022 [Actinomyces ruminicola]
MQIAVTPDPGRWVVIPEFPPPGWARTEAQTRSLLLDMTGPQWRTAFANLLEELRRTERGTSLARLLHVGEGGHQIFAVDLSLVIARDDGTKEGRQATQRALIDDLLPQAEQPQRLRPAPRMAGFQAVSSRSDAGTTNRPSAVVVLRMAGLPTIPVDLVMRAWKAAPEVVASALDDVVALSQAVAPVDALPRTPEN